MSRYCRIAVSAAVLELGIYRAFGALLLLLLCSAAWLPAQDRAPAPSKGTEPIRWPGMQTNGQMLLPTQWSLRPAGKQLLVGDFR